MNLVVHPTDVRMVFLAKAVPDECAKHAQVAVITDSTWHLIGPAPYSAHGQRAFAEMPKVNCPVVDISQVKGKDARMIAVYRENVHPRFGVKNLRGFVEGMRKLGAVIQFAKEN